MKNARRYNMIDEIKMSIHEDQLRLQQIRSNTSEYVFSTRNNESSVSVMIDLHGLTKVEAIRVTKSRLQITLDGLRSGSINPNSGNGKDHIFKVITGAGKHSSRGAVLKPAIYTMLKEMNYEHYADLVNGVFLVRLWKCWKQLGSIQLHSKIRVQLFVKKTRLNERAQNWIYRCVTKFWTCNSNVFSRWNLFFLS